MMTRHTGLITAAARWFRVLVICPLLMWGARAVAQSAETTDSQGLVRIEAPAAMQTYSAAVRSHANAALRLLNEQTGDALHVPVTYIVAENEQQFRALTGGEGENTLAVAFGKQQKVIINYQTMAKSSAEGIRQVLVHELAHVYLEVRCTEPVPRWVHEGVAQYMAGEWPDAPGDARLAIAAYSGNLMPLRRLVNVFPADVDSRNRAYAQSYSAIRFLVKSDYDGVLNEFLKAIRGEKGGEVLKALSGGVALDSFDLRWQKELKSPLYAFTIIISSGFFWGVAAVLVVMAYFVKRRRSRALRQQWAREEAMTGEFESIIDRVERFDEELAEERGEAYLEEEYELEETPYEQYLAEREEADPEDRYWKS